MAGTTTTLDDLWHAAVNGRGVFYSANMLPAPWSYVSRVNPVLYMVEGLRYGVVGTSSSSPWLGLAVTGGIGLLSLSIAAWMLLTGYKLRS